MTATTTLLTRLVERQRSPQPSLRPVLSSRFEPLAGDPELSGEGWVEQEELVVAPHTTHELRPRATPTPSPRNGEAEPIGRAHPVVIRADRVDPEAGGERSPGDPAHRTSPAPSYDEPVVVRPEPAGGDPAPRTPTTPTESLQEPPAMSRRQPLRRGDDAQPVEPTPSRFPEPLVAAQTRHARRDADTPERGSPGDRIVVAPVPATNIPEAPHTPAEHPLTVSVRIGRIEVRAPAENNAAPATDTTRSRRPEPRLSLDDYLARPNRGWS